jgi:hypothetical protein
MSRGYGIQGKKLAHRIVWEENNGPIPEGEWVLHRCDNPPCVNPDHLFLGTRSDNMVDCTMKGRLPQRKLSPDNITAIRGYSSIGVATAVLMEKYGVSHRQILRVLRGENWFHIRRRAKEG